MADMPSPAMAVEFLPVWGWRTCVVASLALFIHRETQHPGLGGGVCRTPKGRLGIPSELVNL